MTAQIGAGGMGEVYQATDVRLHRTVALKVLPEPVAAEPDQKRRLAREARAVAALNHPHICTLYDIGSEDGVDFLVMEYLEGETLAQRLSRDDLPTDLALQYMSEVADALAMAHEHGVIHRDIKPSNILITARGHIKVLDFGIAKYAPLRQPDATGSGTASTVGVFGTASYMSPEQVQQGDIDPRSDLFSLGSVLYECLTGKKAFHGPNALDTCGKIVHQDPTPPSHLNPNLTPEHDHLCEQLLAKNREHRVPSAIRARELIRSAHKDLVKASEADTADVFPAEPQPRPSPDDGPFDVFLSYAREDRELALRLARLLEAKGWSVWWDHRLNPGETWSGVIETQLASARSVVVLWSEHALRSEYVRDEASEGHRRGVLVPAVLGETMPPLGFRQVQTANLHDWKGEREHDEIKSLVGAIATLAPIEGATDTSTTRSVSDTWSSRVLSHPAKTLLRRNTLAVASGAALVVMMAIYAIQLSGPSLPEVPPEAKAMFERGVEQIHQASYSSAVVALEEAVAIHDPYPLAHARLAESRAQLDEQDRALGSLLYANQLAPDKSLLPRTDSLYLDAISGMVRRDFPAAIESYTALSETMPDSPVVRFDLGQALESDDRLPEALSTYNEVIARKADYAPAHLRRGVLLSRLNENDEALESLDRAALLFQTAGNTEGRAEALYRRGVLFNGLRRPAEAVDDLEQALVMAEATQQPDQQIRALAQLSRVARNSGQDNVAERHARRALELAGNRPRLRATALIDLGYAFYLRHDPNLQEAESLFREAIAVSSRFAAHRTKARAQLSLSGLLRDGDLDEVRLLAAEALAFYREGHYRQQTLQALSILSFVQNLRGDLEEAERSYRDQEQIATRLGDSALAARATVNLGFVLTRRGNFPAALEATTRGGAAYASSGISRSVAYAMRDEANLLALLGRGSEATAILDSLTEDPRFAGFYESLRGSIERVRGRVAMTQGRFVAAVDHAATVLADDLTEDSQRIVDAEAIMCVSYSLLRRVEQARSNCENARKMALESHDPVLLNSALLADSESALLAEEWEASLLAAKEAIRGAAALGQLEQEWRGNGLASLASQQLDDHIGAATFSTRSVRLLNDLGAQWGSAALDLYLERSDLTTLTASSNK